jgi:Protein kinase domain/Ankyrin repeats (3 copies)/Ankyrin repeats (many copies)
MVSIPQKTLSNVVLYSLVNEAWKITDFGFTTEGSSQRAHTTVYSRGTRSYRAPELIRETPKYTNKVDLWAVGCILYELVLGQKAFTDDWQVLQHAASGKEFDVNIGHEIIPDNRKREFITKIIRELLDCDPTRRPRADGLYERFISWGSDDAPKKTPSPESHTSQMSQDASIETPPQELEKHGKDIKDGQVDIIPSAFQQSKGSKWQWLAAAFQRLSTGKKALIHAAQDGDIEMVKKLLRFNISTEIKDHDGWTPLDYAAFSGHLEMVKFLVKEAGADVESKDCHHYTPLYYAAMRGHLEVVKFLVKGAGADVESKECNQRTPLLCAASAGHLEVVKFLVQEAGADVEAKDFWGCTALDLARQSKNWGDQEGCNTVAAWLEEKEERGITDPGQT